MSKFVLDTKELRQELAFINSTIDTNPTNPNWTFVLMEISDGKNLVLIGTNGINAAKAKVKLKTPIEDEVSIGLPAKKLLELVRLIEEETVTFSVAEKKITVLDGKGRYGFRLSADIIPHIKPIASQNITPVAGANNQLSAKAFATIISFAAAFAADEESTKFALAGIKVDADETSLKARAMDGHRAIDVTIADPMPGRNDAWFIPIDVTPMLIAFGETGAPVTVVKNDAFISFSSADRVAFVRRSTAENTPKVAQLLDNYIAQNTTTAAVDSGAVLSAVKKLQTAGDGRFRLIRFRVEDSLLKLSARDALSDVMEFESEITSENTGSGEFSLNSGYVVQVLKHLSGTITFRSGGSSNPAIITNEAGVRGMISQMK